MVNPDQSFLQGIVEVDEASVPFREDGRSGKGCSAAGRILLAGAVALSGDKKPRRIRLKETEKYGDGSLRGVIGAVVEPGTQVITDGWSGYGHLPWNPHAATVVSERKAHAVLTRTRPAFSMLKRWAMGVHHGLRKTHVQRYLDAFVFRWNRRRPRATSFGRLPGTGFGVRPVTYRDIVEGRA